MLKTLARACFVFLLISVLNFAHAEQTVGASSFSVSSGLRWLPAVSVTQTPPSSLNQSPDFSLAARLKPGAGELLWGPLPKGYSGEALSLRLLAWSLPWMGAGVIGLWAGSDDRSRGFWGMSGAWALVNAGIAYAGLLGPEPDGGSLRNTLLINAGLDVVYVLGGAYMLSRPEETWRGGGLAIIIQGAFLLAFDLLHAYLVPA
jgi:hypothetical protein